MRFFIKNYLLNKHYNFHLFTRWVLYKAVFKPVTFHKTSQCCWLLFKWALVHDTDRRGITISEFEWLYLPSHLWIDIQLMIIVCCGQKTKTKGTGTISGKECQEENLALNLVGINCFPWLLVTSDNQGKLKKLKCFRKF